MGTIFPGKSDMTFHWVITMLCSFLCKEWTKKILGYPPAAVTETLIEILSYYYYYCHVFHHGHLGQNFVLFVDLDVFLDSYLDLCHHLFFQLKSKYFVIASFANLFDWNFYTRTAKSAIMTYVYILNAFVVGSLKFFMKSDKSASV